MSLLSNFPEVDKFFKKNRFSEDDLSGLIRSLEQHYTDSAQLRAAKELVKLELLKFDLLNEEEKVSNTPVISKEQKWLESIPKEVKRLAEKLEWRTSYLIKLLEQKNIHKKETDELTLAEIISIKEMIKTRNKGVMRNKKSIKGKGSYLNKLKKLNNVVYDDSVYGKMALYGVGKMIYIRSR
jgi:hypothetical protein